MEVVRSGAVGERVKKPTAASAVTGATLHRVAPRGQLTCENHYPPGQAPTGRLAVVFPSWITTTLNTARPVADANSRQPRSLALLSSDRKQQGTATEWSWVLIKTTPAAAALLPVQKQTSHPFQALCAEITLKWAFSMGPPARFFQSLFLIYLKHETFDRNFQYIFKDIVKTS